MKSNHDKEKMNLELDLKVISDENKKIARRYEFELSMKKNELEQLDAKLAQEKEAKSKLNEQIKHLSEVLGGNYPDSELSHDWNVFSDQTLYQSAITWVKYDDSWFTTG